MYELPKRPSVDAALASDTATETDSRARTPRASTYAEGVAQRAPSSGAPVQREMMDGKVSVATADMTFNAWWREYGSPRVPRRSRRPPGGCVGSTTVRTTTRRSSGRRTEGRQSTRMPGTYRFNSVRPIRVTPVSPV